MTDTHSETDGAEYVYRGDTIGNDEHAFQPGTRIRVREHVPADVQGAHDDSEDAVVVVWDEPALGRDDDGNAVIVYAERALSVSVDQFHQQFQPADQADTDTSEEN